MPRFLPSVIAAIFAAICLGFSVRGFTRAAAGPETDFTEPGTFTFTVTEADHYTLWHKTAASIDGIYTVRDARLPAGTEISVTHNGAIVPTVPEGTNSTSGTRGGDKSSVLYFKALEPGDYLVTTTGLPERHGFSLSRGIGLVAIFTIIGWSAAAAFFTVISGLFLLLAFTNIFPKKPLPPRIEQLGV